MLDDLLNLFKNSPRWAQSSLARRLGFSFTTRGNHQDNDPETAVLLNVDNGMLD
jgi:hypothetical protein